MGVLLITDSEDDENLAVMEVCFRYLSGHGLSTGRASRDGMDDKDLLSLNQKIIFGNGTEGTFIGRPRL